MNFRLRNPLRVRFELCAALTFLAVELALPAQPSIVQQAYLKASNTGNVDFFGISVSVDGDTMVIGSFGEDGNATGVNGDQADNSASGSGAAYVFVRNGTNWSQQAYLKASNPAVNDRFGWSVAIWGALVVGANGEDSNATGVNGNQTDNSASAAGAAYVFVRSERTGPSRPTSRLPTPR